MSGTCNKLAFASRADARRYAEHKARAGGNLRPYRCPECGMWHNTTLSKADYRNRVRRYRRKAREIDSKAEKPSVGGANGTSKRKHE